MNRVFTLLLGLLLCACSTNTSTPTTVTPTVPEFVLTPGANGYCWNRRLCPGLTTMELTQRLLDLGFVTEGGYIADELQLIWPNGIAKFDTRGITLSIAVPSDYADVKSLLDEFGTPDALACSYDSPPEHLDVTLVWVAVGISASVETDINPQDAGELSPISETSPLGLVAVVNTDIITSLDDFASFLTPDSIYPWNDYSPLDPYCNSGHQ